MRSPRFRGALASLAPIAGRSASRKMKHVSELSGCTSRHRLVREQAAGRCSATRAHGRGELASLRRPGRDCLLLVRSSRWSRPLMLSADACISQVKPPVGMRCADGSISTATGSPDSARRLECRGRAAETGPSGPDPAEVTRLKYQFGDRPRRKKKKK